MANSLEAPGALSERYRLRECYRRTGDPLSALSQVRRANRCISRLYNLVLASCGLKATQYVLLQAVADADEISQHELAKQLSVASSTLSRRLSG